MQERRNQRGRRDADTGLFSPAGRAPQDSRSHISPDESHSRSEESWFEPGSGNAVTTVGAETQARAVLWFLKPGRLTLARRRHRLDPDAIQLCSRQPRRGEQQDRHVLGRTHKITGGRLARDKLIVSGTRPTIAMCFLAPAAGVCSVRRASRQASASCCVPNCD